MRKASYEIASLLLSSLCFLKKDMLVCVCVWSCCFAKCCTIPGVPFTSYHMIFHVTKALWNTGCVYVYAWLQVCLCVCIYVYTQYVYTVYVHFYMHRKCIGNSWENLRQSVNGNFLWGVGLGRLCVCVHLCVVVLIREILFFTLYLFVLF